MKYFDDVRGFGFIEPMGGGEVFVHVTHVHGGELAAGDRVALLPGRNPRNGKTQAHSVRVLQAGT